MTSEEWPERTRNNQDVDTFRAEGREPGTRRRKLAGYFKAANELRVTYQQNYMQGWSKDGSTDGEAMPGAYPESIAVAGTGEEEMLLFPSYARRHTKEKPTAVPGTIQETAGAGRDTRDSVGAGDAEYWKQQWEKYEDDNAIVDVDVRGWIYTPHKGPLSRKNRLFVSLARQLVGMPAATGNTASGNPSRSSSQHGLRERVQAQAAQHEAEIVAKEVDTLMRRGEEEADFAGKGAYSEAPRVDSDNDSIYSTHHKSKSSDLSGDDRLRRQPSEPYDDPRISPLQKRASWNAPAQMSASELAVANGNLMSRLQPFLALPLANSPISAFFYNEDNSRQRTFETNVYGHFNLRAALDFVPTHVRILAAEGLSFTQEVKVIEPRGVSVISDIDDTIKHSAIASGAREIFRNVFIRDLADLSIQGVKEWYQKMADMDVRFHYVSNSPWQLYPLLSAYFSMAGLPSGSFHLKQYTGMFQGIFEPVAERKKGTLERIMHDFPDRRFLLVGDSGEADLEVYTDVVLEHPGRILGVFIRDVTTSTPKGFFDSSMGPLSGDEMATKSVRSQNGNASNDRIASNPEDAELETAIAASLKDYDQSLEKHRVVPRQEDEQRPALPARRQTEPPVEEEDLIDLTWDDDKPAASVIVNKSEAANANHPALAARSASVQGAPPRPSKPKQLSGTPLDRIQSPPPATKTPPPRPRKPSTSIVTNATNNTSKPIEGQSTTISKEIPSKPQRPPAPPRHSYRDSARQRLSAAYSNLPSPSSYLSGASNTSEDSSSQKLAEKHASSALSAPPTNTSDFPNPTRPRPPPRNNTDAQARPPLPARKPLTSYPVAAAQYASSLYASATSTSSSNTPTNNPGAGKGNGPGSTSTVNNPAVSKKEEMWKRRWARAKAILDEKGVMLRSWRVGGDVVREAVDLVEKEQSHGNGTGNGGEKGKGR